MRHFNAMRFILQYINRCPIQCQHTKDIMAKELTISHLAICHLDGL